MERTDLGRGAWIRLDPHWMADDEAWSLLAALETDCAWEQITIVARGKSVLQPRLTAWASPLPYRYSGQTLPPREAPEVLERLTETVSEVVGQPFNHVMLNLYRDGRDHIGRHADNEPELGRNPTIAALSLGATRRFDLVRRGKPRHHRVRLGHGSLLVMGGTIQHTWWHAVPKTARQDGVRINITFRWLSGPPQPRHWEQA